MPRTAAVPAPTPGRRTARSVVAVGIAVAMSVGVLLAGAGTASADSRFWSDGTRDVGRNHPNIIGVRLSNNPNRMFALTKVRDLSDRTALRNAGAELWIDTSGAGNPEFVIQTGLSRLGTDWNIFRANGWRATGWPLNCDVRASFNYRTDKIKWSAGPDCLGDYGRMRVSATVSKNGRYDYSPGRHRWHPYVARG